MFHDIIKTSLHPNVELVKMQKYGGVKDSDVHLLSKLVKKTCIQGKKSI